LSTWNNIVAMKVTVSPLRTSPLKRNPLYRKIRENEWSATAIAREIGYASLSSFYQALRFEKLPDQNKLAKIARLLDLSAGEVYEIWTKGMAR
jgi:hypothetical protein